MVEVEEWTDSNGCKFTLTQILVCLCCMLRHANGECCAEDDNDTHGLPHKGWHPETTLTLGRLDHESVCGAECEGGCEDYGFSQSSCDWCGDHLHGDRYYAVAWEPMLPTRMPAEPGPEFNSEGKNSPPAPVRDWTPLSVDMGERILAKLRQL